MKKVLLPYRFTAYLSDKPEQGMGYQDVDVELSNGTVLKNRIVLNSTYLEQKDDEDFSISDIVKIKINL